MKSIAEPVRAFVVSEFQSVQALGVATAITLFVALLSDLILLPALLALAGYEVGDTSAALADDRRAIHELDEHLAA